MTTRPTIALVRGDITEQHADILVNAATSSLPGDGAAEPEILAARRDLRASHHGKGLQAGQAVATTAGRRAACGVRRPHSGRSLIPHEGPFGVAGLDQTAAAALT